MAGEYPTLGMGFDFNEIAQAQAQVDNLEKTMLSLDVSAAAAGKSVSASLGGIKTGSIDTSGAKTAAASVKAANNDLIASAKAAAATTGQAWTQSFAAMVTAAINSAGQISAIDAGRIATTMAQEELLQNMQMDARNNAILNAQAVAAAQAAAVAQEMADQDLLATMYLDVSAQRQRAAAEAAAAAAAADAAAVAQQIADQELLATMYLDVSAQRKRSAAEAAAAEIAAAQASTDAQAEAAFGAQAAIVAQNKAAVLDAQAMVALAQAEIAEARAAGLTTESLVAEASAVNNLRNALIQLASAKADQATFSAGLAGANPTLAAASVSASTLTQGDSAAAALTSRMNALEESEEAASKAAKGLEGGIGAVSAASLASSGSVREILVVFRELGNLDFTRMAGSLSRLAQFAGGTALVLQAIPFVAVAGAIAAFTYEVIKASDAEDKLNNLLALTGNTAGVTAGDLTSMAGAIADGTDSSIGKTRSILEAAAGSGKFTSDTLNMASQSVLELSNRTGDSAATILKEFESASDGPSKFADTIFDKYQNVISPAQVNYIHELEDTGNQAQATYQVLKDVYEGIGKTGPENLGYVEQAWRNLTNTISGAIDAARNFGRQQTLQQQYNQAKTNLDAQNSGKGNLISNVLGGNFSNFNAGGDAQKAFDNASSNLENSNIFGAIDELAGENNKAVKSGDDLIRNIEATGKSAQRAAIDIQNYKIAVARSSSPPSAAQQAIDIANIRKRDEGAPKADQHAGAENSIAKYAADIAGLQKQIDSVSADPFSQIAAQITKAGDEAAAHYSAGKNTAFASNARNLAQQKEEETLVLKLVEAYAKEAQAQQDALDVAIVTSAARDAATAAINAYYTASNGGSDDYIAALNAQAQATLNGQIALANLQIAQKDGVTSVDQIAAHYLATVAATGQVTAAEVEHANKLQASAQATLDATAATLIYNAAQKGIAAGQDQHTAALQTIDDLKRQTDAYNGGAAALAAYDQRKAQDAALSKIARPLDATEQFGMVTFGDADPRIAEQQKAINDANTIAQQQALASQAKLNDSMNTQLRLAAETTQERATDAAVQTRISDLVKANGGLYESQFETIAKTEAMQRQQLTDAASLSIKIQDSIRDGFAETGKLDFSKFTQALEQAIYKSIYDQLLAKPISIVVNAAVNVVTSALQSALGSSLGGLLGTGSGGLIGGIGALISKIPGLGFNPSNAADAAALAGTGLGNSFAESASSISSAAKSLAGSIGSVLGAAGIGAGIGGIGQALGLQSNGSSVELGGAAGAALGSIIPGIGTIVGGIIGSIAGSLLGGKSSNDATVYDLSSTGTVLDQTSDKSTSQTAAEATSAAQAIAQGEAALRAAGLTLTTTVSKLDLGVRDSTHITLSNGQVLNTAVGDASAAAQAALQAIVAGATTSDATLQALIDKMSAAGDSITDVANAIQAYQTAQTFVSGIQGQGLQYTDPLAYQLSQLATSQSARQATFSQDVASGYLTSDQATAGQAAIDALNKSELQNALDNFATGVTDASHSLKDFQTAQASIITYAKGLLTGSLSPLSPTDQLAADQTAYNTQLKAAQGGDYTALTGITDTAQTLLTAAQGYYGSTSPYTDIFNQIEDQLNALGDQTITDPTVSAIDQATTDLTAAIGSGADAIVAALQGLSGTSTTTTAPTTSLPKSLTGGGSTAADTNGTTDTTDAINNLNDTLTGVGAAIVSATSGVGTSLAGSVTTASALAGGVLTKCPDPDTPILMHDGTEKRAGDLKVGDVVSTMHAITGEWGTYGVIHVSMDRAPRWKLTTECGKTLIATINHRVMREDEFVELCDLYPGDILAGNENRVVKTIEPWDEGEVVKITVDDAHTYVSAGILSHNIKVSPVMDVV